jgi:Tfp pilus assembly protein PilN
MPKPTSAAKSDQALKKQLAAMAKELATLKRLAEKLSTAAVRMSEATHVPGITQRMKDKAMEHLSAARIAVDKALGIEG